MFLKNKGFTLVELLIVIAIVGILAGVVLLNINPARNKAQAANTKSTLTSLKSVIATCCGDLTNHLQNTPNSDLCDFGTTANLPDNTALYTGSVVYSVVNDCIADNPAIDVLIANHPISACDGHISVTQDGIFSGSADGSDIGPTPGFPAGC